MARSFSSISEQQRGTLAALIAFTIWGLLPLYWQTIDALPLTEIVSIRVICLFIFLALYLLYTGSLGNVLRILRTPKQCGILFISACFLGATWFIDIWAVKIDRVLEASLGYYITPLLNILMGRLFFKDPMSPKAFIAVLLACAGVGYQILVLGYVPLIAIGLGFTFALYGLVRKLAQAEALTGLFVESLLFLPLGILFLGWLVAHNDSVLWHASVPTWLICACLGPVTALPLLCFTYGIRRITMTTFGILQYLTPSMVFLLGLFAFKEELQYERLITFCCIWAGLMLYTWDSLKTAQTPQQE